MLILALRTDKPEAELGLYRDQEQLVYHTWQAHRQLSATLHSNVAKLLKDNDLDWHDIDAIICYKGPGSFTGLRIGLSVANTLATSLPAAIVATSGHNWIAEGLQRLQKSENDRLALPEYGSEPYTTQAKK